MKKQLLTFTFSFAIILFSLQSIKAQVSKEEFEALKAIYWANDLANNPNFNSWNYESNNVSDSWERIVVEDGHVVELDLTDNQLSTLPSEIENLRHLEDLDLSDNQLTALPPEIGNLSSLEYLILSGNQLSFLPPDIAELTFLRGLWLDRNEFKTLPPEIFSLSNLGRLSLSYNQLTALPPEIGNLTNLRDLWLGGNQLTTLPSEIGNLSELTNLGLGNNQFTSLPPEICNLSDLQSLSLSSNQFSTIPQEITCLKELQHLSLRHNQLTTLPSEIGNLTNLRNLWLGGNQLTTLPSEIGSLTNLYELSLSYNQLTFLPPEIGNLINLRHLSLYNNQLSTLPPEIGNITYMGWLHLENNHLNSLPTEIGNLIYLSSLVLANNQLTTLPAEIGNFTKIKFLQLQNNQLTTLPAEIWNIDELVELNLSNNFLTTLPIEIGRTKNVRVDISNNLFESFPSSIYDNVIRFYEDTVVVVEGTEFQYNYDIEGTINYKWERYEVYDWNHYGTPEVISFSEKGNLHFSQISLDDEGYYHCTSTNGQGNSIDLYGLYIKIMPRSVYDTSSFAYYRPLKIPSNKNSMLFFRGNDIDKFKHVTLVSGTGEVNATSNFQYSTTSLIAKFDLSNATPGQYEVVIQKQDRTIDTLSQKLTIFASSQKAEITTDIVGFNIIRPERQQKYFINIQNRGDANIAYLPVWLSVESTNEDFSVDFENEILTLDVAKLTNYHISSRREEDGIFIKTYPVVIPFMESQVKKSIAFNLTTETDAKISVWTNQPLGSDNELNNCLNENLNQKLMNDAYIKENQLEYLINDKECLQNKLNNIFNFDKALLDYNKWHRGTSLYSLKGLFYENLVGCTNNNVSHNTLMKVTELKVALLIEPEMLSNQMFALSGTNMNYNFYNNREPSDCGRLFAADNLKNMTVEVVQSWDPNDKTGITGSDNSMFTSVNADYKYLIRFENKADASAPAQVVRIIDTLDLEIFDIRSLEHVQFSFGDTTIFIEQDSIEYSENIDLRPVKDYIVNVSCRVDQNENKEAIINWQFSTLDPRTMKPVIHPLVGFLPPNQTSPEGRRQCFFQHQAFRSSATRYRNKKQGTYLF